MWVDTGCQRTYLPNISSMIHSESYRVITVDGITGQSTRKVFILRITLIVVQVGGGPWKDVAGWGLNTFVGLIPEVTDKALLSLDALKYWDLSVHPRTGLVGS